MERKRYKPAPFFNMPGAPFNPATGENAGLGPLPGRGTTLAMFQVVEEDTHDNYVVCRGHEADADPYFRYLHDPYTVPTTTPINVAKPYALRGTFPYELGQVIVAARIKGKLGYNQGKAVTVGQPADLDEVISLLTDDADVGISWLDISPPPAAEQALLFRASEPAGGITAVEAIPANLGFDSGAISNISLGAGNNPAGFKKLIVADVAQYIYFSVSGYFHKQVASAGTAQCSIYVKRWNAANVLQSTDAGVVDVPTLSAATAGMSMAFQGRLSMAAGDYVTMTTLFGGTYADTIACERCSIYFRPIRIS
jgi:hypothetical protein